MRNLSLTFDNAMRLIKSMMVLGSIIIGSHSLSFAIDAAAPSNIDPVPSAAPAEATSEPQPVVDAREVEPWDYSPYRVQIWIASDDQRGSANQIAIPLLEYLDRSFAAIWQVGIHDAPAAVNAVATRNIGSLNFESITSSDPVLAVKRDHPDAPRIRFADDVAKYVKKCLSTPDRLAEVMRRGAGIGNPTLDGVDQVIAPIDGDALAVSESWKQKDVEAVILSRGMAAQLTSPEAKIIRLPIDNLVAEDVQKNDKIFIVRIVCREIPIQVEVVELDCLMRHFSPVVSSQALDFASLPAVIGQAAIDAFAPVVRIEDAGQKNAVGVVRAAGLVVDKDSPASIATGEFLQPMLRKDDRNGNPIAIGPIPWAFLLVKKSAGTSVEMDLYAGRMGGLQGRKNKRTFRMALRTRPVGPNSVIRLHAQGAPNEPLAGYEVYEKQLTTSDMELIGRTDWDGRIVIDKKQDAAMRLLYVKNGGAVLARLPMVPGLTAIEVADLVGDDQRLRAEAYIRGTQNAIVDLIAIRTLFAARIRLRLEKGKLEEAKVLLASLDKEPTYDVIANDMGKKVIQFKGRNATEQKKIDTMFAQTREMLVNNINSKLINDLKAEVATAETKGSAPKPTVDGEGAAEQPNKEAQPEPTPAS